MSNNQYRCSRMEMNDIHKFKVRLKHILRMEFKTKNKISNDINLLNYKGNNFTFSGQNDKSIKDIYNELLSSYEDIRKQHRQLHEENNNYSFNEKKQMSIRDGVLYFSNSMNDLFYKDNKSKNDIWNRGVKTINELAKNLNTEVLCITLHTDEGYIKDKETQKTITLKKESDFNPDTMEKVKGTIHFQFYFKGFDVENGKSINIKKNGRLIQDLSFKYFQDLGFTRGETKSDKLNKRYLTVDEYKEYKKTLQEVETTKLELEKVKNELNEKNQLLTEIEEEFKTLNSENIKLKHSYLDLYNGLMELNQIDDRENFLRKFKRYFQKEQNEKIENLLNKYNKIFEKYWKQVKNENNSIIEKIKRNNEIKKINEEKNKVVKPTYKNDSGLSM